MLLQVEFPSQRKGRSVTRYISPVLGIPYKPRHSPEGLGAYYRAILVREMVEFQPTYQISGRIYVSRIHAYSLHTIPDHMSACQSISYLIFGQSKVYMAILGFAALGLESTLPIPRLIRYKVDLAI